MGKTDPRTGVFKTVYYNYNRQQDGLTSDFRIRDTKSLKRSFEVPFEC